MQSDQVLAPNLGTTSARPPTADDAYDGPPPQTYRHPLRAMVIVLKNMTSLTPLLYAYCTYKYDTPHELPLQSAVVMSYSRCAALSGRPGLLSTSDEKQILQPYYATRSIHGSKLAITSSA